MGSNIKKRRREEVEGKFHAPTTAASAMAAAASATAAAAVLFQLEAGLTISCCCSCKWVETKRKDETLIK